MRGERGEQRLLVHRPELVAERHAAPSSACAPHLRTVALCVAGTRCVRACRSSAITSALDSVRSARASSWAKDSIVVCGTPFELPRSTGSRIHGFACTFKGVLGQTLRASGCVVHFAAAAAGLGAGWAACIDQSPNCAGWAAAGECLANPGFMLRQLRARVRQLRPRVVRAGRRAASAAAGGLSVQFVHALPGAGALEVSWVGDGRDARGADGFVHARKARASSRASRRSSAPVFREG